MNNPTLTAAAVAIVDPARIIAAHAAAARPLPSERDLYLAARACGRDVTQERAKAGRGDR